MLHGLDQDDRSKCFMLNDNDDNDDDNDNDDNDDYDDYDNDNSNSRNSEFVNGSTDNYNWNQ